MATKNAGRKGRPWRRIQAKVYEEETHCWLQPWTGCPGYVDQTLPPRTRWSRSVHHIIPPDIRPDLAETRSNLRLAHYGCNSRYGQGEYETRPGRTPLAAPNPHRIVVALFGPPGAGKTTIAAQSGLTIYDRDDPRWKSETHFQHALTQLGHNHQAQAVVIRSGATSTARAKTIHQIGATHAYLITTDQTTCHQRVAHRRRHDHHTSQAAISAWFHNHDHQDQLPTWPGTWDHITGRTPLTPRATPNTGGTTQGGTYQGSRNWA